MDHDIIVLGAGPAGLFSAIFAAQGGRVLLVERMPSCARKLLVSGAGQCNVSHEGSVSDLLHHFGRQEAVRFLRPALNAFGNAELAAWFEARGLALETTEGGKVFPATRRSRDVLAVLLAEAGRAGVAIATGLRATGARREGGGFLVTLEDAGGGRKELSSARLIVATGGRSWPSTGSSGDGLSMAAALGHRIAETAPALTPVIAAPGGAPGDRIPPFAPFAERSGNALRDTTISVFRGGRKAASCRGDVLFTHRGLSGPGILDLSRDIRPGDELRVALATGTGPDGGPLDPGGDGVPWGQDWPGRGVPSEEEADARLQDLATRAGSRPVLRALRSFGLAESVGTSLLAARGIDVELRLALLSRAERRLLALSLGGGGEAGHPFVVAALGSWDEAMVTRGGVALDEVDPKRLESRLVPGLHFAGEVLDYDGDTGGYNIQAAFSTGRLAGLNAAEGL